MPICKDGLILNHPLNRKISTDNGYAGEICPEDSGGIIGYQSDLHKPKNGANHKIAVKIRYATAGPPQRRKSIRYGPGHRNDELVQLVDLPLELLSEISFRLEPVDILYLSRVSQYFRSIFASRDSRHVWQAARRNIPHAPGQTDFPDCPPDLNELQFASFMFEHDCQACGQSPAQPERTDCSLRVRFCGPCFKKNIRKGSTLKRSHRMIPETIFTLLPRSFIESSGFHPRGAYRYRGSFEANMNNSEHAYYVPEFKMLVKRYAELQSDPTALSCFVEQQQAIACQMMKTAITMDQCFVSSKTLENHRCRVSRKAGIDAKLVELGWHQGDYPRFDRDWNTIVNQPRELTPRIWKMIGPELELLLQEERDRRIQTGES